MGFGEQLAGPNHKALSQILLLLEASTHFALKIVFLAWGPGLELQIIL